MRTFLSATDRNVRSTFCLLRANKADSLSPDEYHYNIPMIPFLLERPIVFLLLMAIPLSALAYFRNAFPHRRTLLLFALPAIVALAQIYFPIAGIVAAVLLILVVLASLADVFTLVSNCLLYTSPSPRDATLSRMPSSA